MRIYMTFELPEAPRQAPSWPWHAAAVTLALLGLPREAGVVPLDALTEAIAEARVRLGNPAAEGLPTFARTTAERARLHIMLTQLEQATVTAKAHGAKVLRWREDLG